MGLGVGGWGVGVWGVGGSAGLVTNKHWGAYWCVGGWGPCGWHSCGMWFVFGLGGGGGALTFGYVHRCAVVCCVGGLVVGFPRGACPLGVRGTSPVGATAHTRRGILCSPRAVGGLAERGGGTDVWLLTSPALSTTWYDILENVQGGIGATGRTVCSTSEYIISETKKNSRRGPLALGT